MSSPSPGLLSTASNNRLLAIALALLAVSGPFGLLAANNTSSVYTPQTVAVTLVVQTASVEVSPGNVISMWSYNGTVPGPVLRINTGDTLLVTLKNQHTMKHSLHVHGLSYNITSDGSQGDPGKSDLGIIAPGQQYTYTYMAARPGVYVYHCHSDDMFEVSVHIQQGLYGAIIVNDPANPLPAPNREYTLFLGEAYGQVSFSMFHGCAYCFGNSKFFTINARQLPLTPTLTAKPGELVRLYIINVGNDIHSFHLHGHAMTRWRIINNQWASVAIRNDNKGFVPLEAAIIDVRAQSPGRWLYHCHVEPHADTGMMGVFDVQSGTPPVRDLSIGSVLVPDPVYQGQIIPLSSQVFNQGQVSETFVIETFTYSGGTIGSTMANWIDPSAIGVFNVYWDTSGVSPGSYEITASLPMMPGETDAADNSYTIMLLVRIVGDLDGDSDVDIVDAATVAYSFDTTPDNPRWNRYADLDGNNVIDIIDAALVAFHFGETA